MTNDTQVVWICVIASIAWVFATISSYNRYEHPEVSMALFIVSLILILVTNGLTYWIAHRLEKREKFLHGK